ncbi:FCGBP protein, partial [Glareola pratincola]|nr:FCGBP protein [Glareola pratincola]
VRTAFGLRVSFDWYSYARVILPDAYAGAVCGLCGNANGDPDDDFIARDGKRAADEIQLADSWKVGDVPGCSAGCVGDCPVCNEEQKKPYRGDGYCGVIARAGGPFRACHRAIDPTPFLEDCAFDACHYKGHRATVCKAIAAYVTECQSRGIGVEPWRTPSFCGEWGQKRDFPLRLAAKTKGLEPNRPLLASLRASGNTKHFQNWVYLPRFQHLLAMHLVYPLPPQFRGQIMSLDVGKFPPTHFQSKIPSFLHATVQNESLLPSGFFPDARKGNTKSPEPRLANFSVLLEHDVGGRGNVALMKKVVISIHGYRVSVERGRKWEVDGERYTLPLVTEDKKLRIGQEGNNIILQTVAGLRLLYNVATYLLITIPDAYRGRVCGLGGNYNGDPSDDFQLPSGSLAQSTEEFVTSWKVPVEDGACTDGCDGKVCPTCDAADTAPYGASDSCGLILDPVGPFGPCHPRVSPMEYFNHCLHDVCAADGARDALCHSLQAYAAACQAAGAEIGGWRTTAFC